MRILVVNPNSSRDMTRNIDQAANEAASPEAEIVTACPALAPASIESFAEDIVASYRTIEYVFAQEQHFDGVVVACYYDPAVHALREVLDVPVVGIAEGSMHVGALLAPKFSIVTVLSRGISHVEKVVKDVGLEQRCASVRAVDLGVLDIEEDFTVAAAQIEKEARYAVAYDGAEAILLGCAGMGPLHHSLQDRLGVPVVDGVGCAVSLVEACVRNQVTTSASRTFQRPPAKSVEGLDDVLALLSG